MSVSLVKKFDNLTVTSHVISTDSPLRDNMIRFVTDNRLTHSREVLNYIVRASEKDHLKNSTGAMSLREFIEASEFPIDGINVNRFFNGMRNGMKVLVDDDTLDWMGYAGEKNIQRGALKKSLQAHDEKREHYRIISAREITKMRKELIQGDMGQFLIAPTEKEIDDSYPEPVQDSYTSRRKFFLVEPRLLKKIMMSLKTANGDKVREYFLSLEELIVTYDTYQQAYNGVTLNNRCLQLKRKNAILDRDNTTLVCRTTEKENQLRVLCEALTESRGMQQEDRSYIQKLEFMNCELEAQVEEANDRADAFENEATNSKKMVNVLTAENEALQDEVFDFEQRMEEVNNIIEIRMSSDYDEM